MYGRTDPKFKLKPSWHFEKKVVYGRVGTWNFIKSWFLLSNFWTSGLLVIFSQREEWIWLSPENTKQKSTFFKNFKFKPNLGHYSWNFFDLTLRLKVSIQKLPSRPHSTTFFSWVTHKVSRRLKFKIWGLSDHTLKSYETKIFKLWQPLAASNGLGGQSNCAELHKDTKRFPKWYDTCILD